MSIMAFFIRTCFVVFLANAAGLVDGSDTLGWTQLQPEDRRLLDDVVKKSSRTAEMTADLVRQVQELASSVTAAVDGLQNKTKDIERLEQKVDSIGKEVAVIKERQNASAEETNKKLEDLAKHSSDQLKGLESSILNNVSSSIQHMTNATEAKCEDVESSVKKLPELIGEQEWMRSLQRSVKRDVKKFWHIENVTEHGKKALNESVELHSDKFVIGGYTTRFQAAFVKIGWYVYLEISLQMCMSDEDSLLQWPFVIPYTTAINHPNDPKKKDIKTVTVRGLALMYDITLKPDSSNSCIYVRGSQVGASWEFLKKEGFVMSDAITVSVTLHPDGA